jgi:hypothetical protein
MDRMLVGYARCSDPNRTVRIRLQGLAGRLFVSARSPGRHRAGDGEQRGGLGAGVRARAPPEDIEQQPPDRIGRIMHRAADVELDTNRARPGLREALAACRSGDTRMVTKLDRLAPSLTDARHRRGTDRGRQLRESPAGSSDGSRSVVPHGPVRALAAGHHDVIATTAQADRTRH